MKLPKILEAGGGAGTCLKRVPRRQRARPTPTTPGKKKGTWVEDDDQDDNR